MAAVAITRSSAWVSQRWVFTVTVAFFYTSTVLRSVLLFDDGERVRILEALAVWLVLLLTEPVLSRLWRPYFAVCVGLEALVVRRGCRCRTASTTSPSSSRCRACRRRSGGGRARSPSWSGWSGC
jgi:hypothetical protein